MTLKTTSMYDSLHKIITKAHIIAMLYAYSGRDAPR